MKEKIEWGGWVGWGCWGSGGVRWCGVVGVLGGGQEDSRIPSTRVYVFTLYFYVFVLLLVSVLDYSIGNGIYMIIIKVDITLKHNT